MQTKKHFRRILLCLLASTMVFTLNSGFDADPASAAKPVNLTYKVYAGGLHLATLIAIPHVTGQRYEFAVSARSEGVVKYLFDWKLNGFAEGVRAVGSAIPESYQSHSGDNGDTRSVHIQFSDGSPDSVVAEPPYSNNPADKLPRDMLVNTLDPLTATLQTLMLQAPEQACSSDVSVYDGRRRYDVLTRNAAEQILKRSQYSMFSGKARRCDVLLKRIAGFNKKKQRFYEEPGAIRLWLANMPTNTGDLTVPVRLQSDTKWGTLIAHLTKLD